MSSNIYYRRAEAATYIRQTYFIPCSTATLAKLASIGGGPQFRRFGRIPIYEHADLDAWATSKISKKYSSTSEYGMVEESNLEETKPAA